MPPEGIRQGSPGLGIPADAQAQDPPGAVPQFGPSHFRGRGIHRRAALQLDEAGRGCVRGVLAAGRATAHPRQQPGVAQPEDAGDPGGALRVAQRSGGLPDRGGNPRPAGLPAAPVLQLSLQDQQIR